MQWRGEQVGTESPWEGVMSTLTTHKKDSQQPQCGHRPCHPPPLTRAYGFSSACWLWNGTGAGLAWGLGKKRPEMQSDTSRLVMRGLGLGACQLGQEPKGRMQRSQAGIDTDSWEGGGWESVCV